MEMELTATGTVDILVSDLPSSNSNGYHLFYSTFSEHSQETAL